MTLETFFEQFELFADAPNAVAKIRELVRQLAVQGKIVDQDPNDEPADALVARIAAALPSKKSENPFLCEIEDSIIDESEYELPPGWAWLPLGHVGIWATGCGFPMQYQGETDGEFLFCKVSDMNLPGNEVEIRKTIHSIDSDVMKKIRARANPVGTVIFPKIGGAIATHKRRLVIKPTIIDNNCSGIQPIGLTDDRWLLLFMRTLDLTKYQSGTSVPAVSQGSLDPIRIGLPPLAEQKRIVAKVDELMALCDRLEAQHRERETRQVVLARAALARFADAPTPANLDFIFHPAYTISPADLRKAILTLAVQGKLVPQDADDEPAEVLLTRLEKFKQENPSEDGRRSREAPDSEPGNSDYPIPPSWAWARLSTIALRINDGNYGESYPTKSELLNEGIPFLTSASILADGSVDRAHLKYISSEKQAELTKAQIIPGDVIFPNRGARGGQLKGNEPIAIVVPDWLVDGNVNPQVTRIRLHPEYYLNHLLCAVLRTPLFLDQFESATGGTALPFINLTKTKAFTVPVPPLAEQRRIVAKVEQLMALVDALEAQLATARATAVNLLDALVAELTGTPHSGKGSVPAAATTGRRGRPPKA